MALAAPGVAASEVTDSGVAASEVAGSGVAQAWPVSKRLILPLVIVKAHRVRISPQVSLR